MPCDLPAIAALTSGTCERSRTAMSSRSNIALSTPEDHHEPRDGPDVPPAGPVEQLRPIGRERDHREVARKSDESATVDMLPKLALIVFRIYLVMFAQPHGSPR
jgi:hypothetical protein